MSDELANEAALDENEDSNRGSTSRSGRGQGANELSDRKFNLNNSKNLLLSQIEESCSSRFKMFFKSSLCNRFLHTFILYFVSYFQLHALKRDGKGTRAEHSALTREMEKQLQELAPVYATIIMQESDYHHTEQDKKFFEHLYETTTEILLQAFPGQRRQVLLEDEIGRVMRTPQFNSHSRGRLNKGHISECALSVRELYQIKHEGDPALNSRILSNLYQKKVVEGTVTLASVSNTPLIGKIISPLDHGVAKKPNGGGNEVESLRERMPWKYGRRPRTRAPDPLPGADGRNDFLSFSRGSDQLPIEEIDFLNRRQKHRFDEGLHRINSPPLPGIQGYRDQGSRCSSRASTAGDRRPSTSMTSLTTTSGSRSLLKSAGTNSYIGKPSPISRPKLMSQGSQRKTPVS